MGKRRRIVSGKLANADIRQALKENHLMHKDVAEVLGVDVKKFGNDLRKEWSYEQKKKVFEVIEGLTGDGKDTDYSGIGDRAKLKMIGDIIGVKVGEAEKYNIYSIGPIDFWGGAQVVSVEEFELITGIMPEEARTCEGVYKTWIPCDWDGTMAEVYMCKAENNGTVYLFTKSELPVFRLRGEVMVSH